MKHKCKITVCEENSIKIWRMNTWQIRVLENAACSGTVRNLSLMKKAFSK